MSNSLWIVFFVQRENLPEPFNSNFALITAAELAGDFLALCVMWFSIYVFYKVHFFHFNLATIWINAYLILFAFVILRFFLIPFQFGYLQNSPIKESIIEIISTIRFIQWISLYHLEVLIAIERVFALCFVATYEKVPRRYISGIIIISNYIVSAFLGYLAVHKIIHGFYYLALVFITSNIAYLTVLYLNWAGKRKQNELLEKYRGYSVSYRWQLQQNIEAAKQLAVLMIIINLCISVILPCIFVPALLLDNDENGKATYEVAKLMLQLLFSISFAPMCGGIALAIPRHRQWLFARSVPINPESYRLPMENYTSDEYFARLGDAWNK